MSVPPPTAVHGGGDQLEVVIAHEWITVPGGSEKVVQALCEIFPRARVVAAVVDPDTAGELFPGRAVTGLWVGRLPKARQKWPYYGPAMMAAWAAHRIGPADLLISSNHFATNAAGLRFPGPHLSYVYTPLRMAWRPDIEAMRLPAPLAPLGRAMAPALRSFDRRAAKTVDSFVAISREVRDRIARAYGRPATLVHPPVDVARFFGVRRRPQDYVLCHGRLVGYKRVDLAVAACTALGVRLIVSGDGPELARLRQMAGPTVQFVGRLADPDVLELLGGAGALLFPGEEDFGIVPVEAQAAGCPVIAFGRGGALDTVDPGLGNVLVATQTAQAFCTAIRTTLDATDDPHGPARRAAMTQFGPDRFKAGISAAVSALLDRPPSARLRS